MANEENILPAMVMLSKYFAEHGKGKPMLAQDVIAWIRLGAPWIGKAELKLARKKLGIRSMVIADNWYWFWGIERPPEEVWAEKSKEALGTDERKRH